MSGHQIRPEDYSYPPEQQAIAEAERDLLGRQLTALGHTERFTMQRNAARRRDQPARFDIVSFEGVVNEPAYVKDERLVHALDGEGIAWFGVDRAEAAEADFYRRRRNATTELAPIHVVCQGRSVIKGDSSPEPTDRRLAFSDRIVADLAESEPARVAVIDTGLTAEVRRDQWLAGLIRRTDTEDQPGNIDELDSARDTDTLLDLGAGHGTFVAGIVQQVCPSARITAYRALDTDGVGREDLLADTLIEAAEGGQEIIVLSLGTTTADGEPPLALRQAMRRLAVAHPDVLVIAAAGNDGTETPMWPAAFKNVVAVAALTADGRGAEWSSHGDWIDCSTVGEGIVSTFVNGTEATQGGSSTFGPDSWAMWTGTSFAAPQVAGAVARLVQANRDQGWTPRQAYAALIAGKAGLPGYGQLIPVLPGTARPEGFAFPEQTTAPVQA